MSDLIKLLPDSIANQIAAGEVIQRPASVVKELLENAIDAGGTKIQLIFKDAGKTLIQVIDNGIGMSGTDARMCFERHATSKIKQAADIFTIKTMGFRGEALASIAAIAQVDLKTRRSEDELGTQIIMEASEVRSQEPAPTAVGTSISVKNLFFNVPARRKFLKSNPVETRHILDEFQRVALANPHIYFTVHNNSNEIYHLKAGNNKQRIVSLMGRNHDKRLVPIEENTDFLEISGFIGKPQYAKKSRGEQFFFVNDRFIKSPYLHAAIMELYSELMPEGSYPLYVVHLKMEPNRIDVNVHPTKQEIKFDDEKVVFTFLQAAVKRALGAYSITPALDFDQEASLAQGDTWISRVETQDRASQPKEATGFGRNTGGGGKAGPGFRPPKDENLANWKELYKTQSEGKDEPAFTTVQSSLNRPKEDAIGGQQELIEAQSEIAPFQIHQRYIIYQMKSGLIYVDQQAAHERILYERNLEAFKQGSTSTQKLLFPYSLEVNAPDAEILRGILEEVQLLGYRIKEKGENLFVISGVPSDVSQGEVEGVFEELIEQFRVNAHDLKLNKRDHLARSLARQSAMKAGKHLSIEEMKGLIDQLFACEIPYVAPNGRLTFVTQSLDQIDKQFRQS